MDLQSIIDNQSRIWKEEREAENYSLGELISDLEKANQEGQVYISKLRLEPVGFTSYRGYYSDLALDFNTDGSCKVSELLEMCEKCVGKTFTGYKGGEFTMNEKTMIWVANYGNTTGVVLSGLNDLYGEGSHYELTIKEYEQET